jgi:hypothetical protein
MILELKAPLPLETPKGPGFAYFLIDYGMDHDLLWVCFIDATRECWTFRNGEIRAVVNISVGRRETSLPGHVIELPHPSKNKDTGWCLTSMI